MVDKRLIAGLVEFGVVASVQPAFDRLWGGDEPDVRAAAGRRPRSLESNPMGAMHGVGVALAFGSDSPVTPLDPWGGGAGGACATATRRSGWACGPAFAAHTRGGWRAVHRDADGRAGARARRRRSRCGTRRRPAPAGCRRSPDGPTRRRRRCRSAGAPCCADEPILRRDELSDGASSTSIRRWSRRARALAAPGRAAGGRPGPRAHHGRRWSGRCCAWPGSTGADPDGIPWVNRLVDAVGGRRRAGARGGAAGVRTRWRREGIDRR